MKRRELTIRYMMTRILVILAVVIFASPAFAEQVSEKQSFMQKIFGSKDGTMGSVATKIAEFKEDDDVSSLEFSPDGTQLAVDTALKSQVHIWEWRGRAHIICTLFKPPYTGDFLLSADGIRYNVDGNLLAVTHKIARDEDGHGVVRIFNTETGLVAQDIGETRSGGAHSRIAFTADGQWLIRTFDRGAPAPGDTFIVHRTDTWEAVWGLRTIPLYIRALALSSNGSMAAVGGMVLGPGQKDEAQIILIDLVQRQVVRTIRDAFPQGNSIEVLAWNPDGVHLAAGVRTGDYAGAVRIFDIRTGKQILEEKPAELGGIVGLKYTPDGKYLIESGVHRNIEIWDAQHQRLLQEITGVDATANTAVSRDSRYFAVGDHLKVTVWQFR